MRRIVLLLALIILAGWWGTNRIRQPVRAVAASRPAPPVDPDELERHVRMLAEAFVPRHFEHPENLDRTAGYVRTHFEATGGRVSEQAFSAKGRTYRNVILELGPQSGRPIVLGAHYDAFETHPAADDNASGVAGLIELAELLADEELSKPLLLVAYTLEEPPFFRTAEMGSAVHAASLAAAGREIEFMISTEMIGYFSDETDSQMLPLTGLGLLYPSEGNFIGVIGRLRDGALVRSVKRSMIEATELPVESFNAPPSLVPGIDFSDHLDYWHHGYPAVMVTDTAFYRNFAYHTADDTPDRLDYARMADVVRGLYRVVLDHQ